MPKVNRRFTGQRDEGMCAMVGVGATLSWRTFTGKVCCRPRSVDKQLLAGVLVWNCWSRMFGSVEPLGRTKHQRLVKSTINRNWTLFVWIIVRWFRAITCLLRDKRLCCVTTLRDKMLTMLCFDWWLLSTSHTKHYFVISYKHSFLASSSPLRL